MEANTLRQSYSDRYQDMVQSRTMQSRCVNTLDKFVRVVMFEAQSQAHHE